MLIFLHEQVVAADDATTTTSTGQTSATDGTTEFAPLVAATCKAGVMNIKVTFATPYSGAVHARDYRNSHCMVYGNGTERVGLSLNLLAKQGQSDYCGILVSGGGNSEVSFS